MLIIAIALSLFCQPDSLPEKWERMLEYFPDGVYESISFTDYEELRKLELYRFGEEYRKKLKTPKFFKSGIPSELKDRIVRSVSGTVMRFEINKRKIHKVTDDTRKNLTWGFAEKIGYPEGATEEEKRKIDGINKEMQKSMKGLKEGLLSFIASLSTIMIAEIENKEELLSVLRKKGLIEAVQEGRQIKEYQIFKLTKHNTRNASKNYFITFLEDGQTLLIADYYPQLFAMLDAGYGNIMTVKDRGSF